MCLTITNVLCYLESTRLRRDDVVDHSYGLQQSGGEHNNSPAEEDIANELSQERVNSQAENLLVTPTQVFFAL